MINEHPIAEQSFLTEDAFNEIFSQTLRLSSVLRDIVAKLGNRLEVDVCSIYLREKDAATLVLAATVGLNQNCVGSLRMGLHEGLAGMVAEEMQPVAIAEATKHPRFKYFPEAEEDAYESFLGVPIDSQGVLVVQTVEPRSYSPVEILRLLNQATMLGACLNKS
ncbi:GAF domain-containing protein [Adhaeretor mobilis]|uniref:Fused phosphoenolpyruvate-protein phosphotransferase PtsP/GAF domain protein n=1 Tax=Adhaeretor mobilis TaxID=1930276 RepID=A0A517N1R0_9BACT|nr:GAF domain-containing protein [Adhaeretor mobilis]QDT01065.1 fused phosphoenolpyruvate-protein phosphotransferase PtsP/GAF domain protein [Adhaeretor mobilis]